MSYKPPMGDPELLKKRVKPSTASTREGGRYGGVESVVYTGTSSSLMNLVRTSEPSLKQQPGELFRRVRPTTVANFVEQQELQRQGQQLQHQQQQGGGSGGEALRAYCEGIVPLDEHAGLRGGNGGSGGSGNGNPYMMHPQASNTPQIGGGGGRRSVSAGSLGMQHHGGSGGSVSGALTSLPMGGRIHIDRSSAVPAYQPPSRNGSAAGGLRAGGLGGTNASQAHPHHHHHPPQTPQDVSDYNQSVARSLRGGGASAYETGAESGGDLASYAPGGGGHRGGGGGVVSTSNMHRIPPPPPPGLPRSNGVNRSSSNTNNKGAFASKGRGIGHDDDESAGGNNINDVMPINQRKMIILDVRDREDYDRCHILGALHYPQIRLAHATNPYALPEILLHKNKPDCAIILYDLEEEITVQKKMGNIFFEKGADNVYVMAGGLREFVQTHVHLISGESPVPVVAKSSRLEAYGIDKSTKGSFASRSIAPPAQGGGGSAGITRRSASGVVGPRVPRGLSSSLASVAGGRR